MKCKNCKKEIKGKFYKINDDFYCENCIEEKNIIIYRVKNTNIFFKRGKDYIFKFKNIDYYITYLKNKLFDYKAKLQKNNCSSFKASLIKIAIINIEKEIDKWKNQKQ